MPEESFDQSGLSDKPGKETTKYIDKIVDKIFQDNNIDEITSLVWT